MHLVRGDDHQSAQGRLVQAREDHPGDHEKKHHFPQYVIRQAEHDVRQVIETRQLPGKIDATDEPLAHNRREFQIEHGQIYHHAHAHLEQHRVALPHPRHHRMPDVVPSPQVEHQPDAHKGISQRGSQQRRPDDGVKMLAVEDVDQGAGSESARGQGHARGHVDADPQSPGVLIVQVGHRRQAEDHAVQSETHAGHHHGDQDHHARREEFLGHRRSLLIHAHVHHPYRT